ncbi:MAG: preprotein translocase subunit YajC [Planctomycetia bacterium]|nr:preprotein translocase subunit YajC [Planctomycetia bacterium]
MNIIDFSLLAEAAKPAPPSTEQSIFSVLMIVSMMLIVMYLLFVLPKKNQEKNARKMIDSLKKNDKVMTTSGMIGTIYSIDKDQNEVVLKVDESNNTKIKFSLGAVYFVFKDKEKEAEKEKDKP